MIELWPSYLTFALLAFLATPGFGLSSRVQLLRFLVFLIAGFIPVDGLPLALYLRGLIDDISIVGLVILSFSALVRMRLIMAIPGRQRWQLILLFALLALILYPATLGLSYIDPYRLGYNPRPLLLAMGLLSLCLVLVNNWLGACVLGVATLAFSLELKPSQNYWDYLIDPLVAFYCWFALLRAAIGLAWNSFRSAVFSRQAAGDSLVPARAVSVSQTD